jgi:hypothetical protein
MPIVRVSNYDSCKKKYECQQLSIKSSLYCYYFQHSDSSEIQLSEQREWTFDETDKIVQHKILHVHRDRFES